MKLGEIIDIVREYYQYAPYPKYNRNIGLIQNFYLQLLKNACTAKSELTAEQDYQLFCILCTASAREYQDAQPNYLLNSVASAYFIDIAELLTTNLCITTVQALVEFMNIPELQMRSCWNILYTHRQQLEAMTHALIRLHKKNGYSNGDLEDNKVFNGNIRFFDDTYKIGLPHNRRSSDVEQLLRGIETRYSRSNSR